MPSEASNLRRPSCPCGMRCSAWSPSSMIVVSHSCRERHLSRLRGYKTSWNMRADYRAAAGGYFAGGTQTPCPKRGKRRNILSMSEDPTKDIGEKKYDTRPILENLLREVRGGFA